MLKCFLFKLERTAQWSVLVEVLTNKRVGDVGPVDAVLQLQLVVRLDVEQEVLVEADSGDQVSPVGALQSTAAVDVLHKRRGDTAYGRRLPHRHILIFTRK